MKERGIIFNGSMVRVIISRKKTQTRRAISAKTLHLFDVAAKVGECHYLNSGDPADERSQPYYRQFCPFGQPGDRLWVRETWGVVSHTFDDDDMMVEWVPDRPATKIHEMPFGNGYYSGHAIYRADGHFGWCTDDDGGGDERTAWHPSIHMPRAAARILLEITDVRVERLNDISNEDAIAEGMDDGTSEAALSVGWFEKPRRAFQRLWAQIYGQESWDGNPWVWVVEFKQVPASAGKGSV